MMRKLIIAGIVLTLIIIAFVGVYWANESNRITGAQQKLFAEEMRLGARTYTSQCAQCHGVNGEGLVGPALNDNQLPEDALTRIIERGIPHSTMTAWSLEEGGPLQEYAIQHLVLFVTNWDDDLLDSARAELDGEGAGVEASGVDEFASAGEALFIGKGCATCHGDNALGLVQVPGDSCLTCHTGDLRSLEVAPSLPGHSAEDIEKKVREGGRRMPSFDEDKITEAELVAILAFIDGLPVPELSNEAKAALGQALEAVRNEEIFWANLKLEEALAAADLLVQKAQIEKIIDYVTFGNLSEAAEQLEALAGDGDGHDH